MVEDKERSRGSGRRVVRSIKNKLNLRNRAPQSGASSGASSSSMEVVDDYEDEESRDDDDDDEEYYE